MINREEEKIMKDLQDYLLESKKVYSFKIKLAGDITEDHTNKLKDALEKFSVVNLSAPKRTPIQAVPLDFPNMENINVNIYEFECHYPTIPSILEQYVSQTIGWPLSCVRVRYASDIEEMEQTQKVETETEALLNNPEMGQADEDAQGKVGQKRISNLLKELSKTKHQGEQYKGVNDAILASNLPEETKQIIMQALDIPAARSIVGNGTVTFVDPYKGK